MSKLTKTVGVLLAALILGSAVMPAAMAAAPTDYTVVDPYAAVDWDTWEQYKANLHTHSTFSDGEFTLPDMVEKYYDMGYDILAMTDHGVINYGWNKPHNTFPPFCKVRRGSPAAGKTVSDVPSTSITSARIASS